MQGIDRLERALDALDEQSKTPRLQYVVVDASSILFERHAGVAVAAAAERFPLPRARIRHTREALAR